MRQFPLDVWGRVISSVGTSKVTETSVEMIKIVASQHGGFLLCTVEKGSTFDMWIETAEEIEEELMHWRIEWGTL